MIEFAIVDNGPTDLPLKANADGQLLPTGTLDDMHRSMQRAVVDQIRNAMMADQLGFHYCFFTEHHFEAEGQEFSPNPLLLGAAIAGRTKYIRLGQSANILSWHHPIRLAEQAAMLDVLSGGRLEFGVGRGLQPRETDMFGPYYGSSSSDEASSLRFFEEAVDVIVKAWSEPSFSHDGTFFKFPTPNTPHHHDMTIAYFAQPGMGRELQQVLEVGKPTGHDVGLLSHETTMKEMQVFPRPLQRPYPQIWQPVVMSARSMARAARLGMNAFIIGSGVQQIARDVDAYMQAAEAEGWVDRTGGGPFKRGWDSSRKRGVCHVQYVHNTAAAGGDGDRFLTGLSARMQYLSPFMPSNVGFNKVRLAQDPMEGLNFIGGTQEIIDGFMKLKQLGGYDDFLCAVDFNAAGISGEETRDQLQCFVEEVMPELVRACGGALPRVEPDPEFSF